MIYTAPCITFWMRAYPLRGRPVCSAQCPERMGPLGKPQLCLALLPFPEPEAVHPQSP